MAGLVRGEGVSSPPNAYLVATHIHSSMSEGYSTMENHIEQAELGGFDGVWFTDHMVRQGVDFYPLEMPLDGTLEGALLPFPISQPSVSLVEGGQNPSILSLSYSSSAPKVGSKNLRVDAGTSGPFSSGFKWATLSVKGHDRGQRISLLGEPELSVWVKLKSLSGYAGVAMRMKLSGEPNGTDTGKIREIEFLPGNFQAPSVRPGCGADCTPVTANESVDVGDPQASPIRVDVLRRQHGHVGPGSGGHLLHQARW